MSHSRHTTRNRLDSCGRAALLLLVTAAAGSSGCKHADGTDDGAQTHARSSASTPEGGPATVGHTPPKNAPRVVLHPAGGEPVTVYVEVVSEPREVRRGLMYREFLGADHGMLFLMPDEKIQTFWMKNTLISLDMIFIKRDKTVAGVVENTEPLTLKSRSVPIRSIYVLEVNAGWSKRHGVTALTPVEFVNIRE